MTRIGMKSCTGNSGVSTKKIALCADEPLHGELHSGPFFLYDTPYVQSSIRLVRRISRLPAPRCSNRSTRQTMSFRLTFRKTEKERLHVVAHPDPSGPGAHAMVVEHADPTVFTSALGQTGVSTEFESSLSIAAQQAWNNQGMEVCCEAVDLMAGQLDSLGFRAKS